MSLCRINLSTTLYSNHTKWQHQIIRVKHFLSFLFFSVTVFSKNVFVFLSELDVELGDLLQEFNDVVKELSTSHVNEDMFVKRLTGLSDAEDSDYSKCTLCLFKGYKILYYKVIRLMSLQ